MSGSELISPDLSIVDKITLLNNYLNDISILLLGRQANTLFSDTFPLLVITLTDDEIKDRLLKIQTSLNDIKRIFIKTQMLNEINHKQT